ncbi:MAG: hypothetical protein KJN73_01910 [Acidimicrobiia bacterium]|nr:hypothetical protein [Acidimicrobiia bacterium]NNF89669.1 hypothetical protein [Acidimicrobiia bacterium]NNJ47275.1 hypothetical protein [Acidimicrobiia bacterium]RZV41495.1 MAG: hypothetical protein EX267_11100 [Acidimicrobiia bacterium]
MNLAGNQAKQLFKSLRTGSRPSVVGLWAAATAVEQMRKRSKGSGKELIATKKLKPGESYVIRMPGKNEGSMAGSLAPGTVVAEVETNREESIPAQLLSVATDLLGAASEESKEPSPTRRRQRRTTSLVADEEETATPGRRERRRAAKEAEKPVEKVGRRQRRKAARAEVAEPAPAEESFASSLVDVAASFMGTDDESTEVAPPKVSRRRRRRSDRLATLEDVDFDREALPRRRGRKLRRAERRAEKRPTRKRVRRARKQQKGAAKTVAKIERRPEPSRRRRRKIRAAERELDYRRTKVEKRSTRRRRRKLKKAEKAFEKLT